MAPPPLPAAPKKPAGCLKIGLFTAGVLFAFILIAGLFLPKPAPETPANSGAPPKQATPAQTPPLAPTGDPVQIAADTAAKQAARDQMIKDRALRDEAKAKEKAASDAAASKAKAEADTKAAAERERLITQITWKEISALYSLKSKATDIVKEEKWKGYQWREVRWTGTVSDISKTVLGDYTLAVKMNEDTLTSDILVELRKDQVDAAFKLSKGDKVTYEAKLKSWGTLLPITAIEGAIISK